MVGVTLTTDALLGLLDWWWEFAGSLICYVVASYAGLIVVMFAWSTY